MQMSHVKWMAVLGLAGAMVGCGPSPTPIPVTLTVPPPTPTVAPVDLVPGMEIGAEFAYADGTALVAVPHGAFVMGHGSADNPEHTVTLSDFWVYSTEVTNHQYAICVDQGLCTEPDATDNPDYGDYASQNKPVVGVSYEQASDYCSFMHADLPTEAQWEKAARGKDARLYPWGGSEPSCKLLNFGDCLKSTSDVTTYGAGESPYGALDMSGNVYEWVADWYDPLYYESSPTGDPPGPASGDARVIRSSGFRSSASESQVYARSYSSPRDHRADLGFRCVVKDPGYFAPACELAPVFEAADMTSVAEDCPQLSIDVVTTACRYGGGAVVTFNNDHSQDPNASFGGIVGCTLLSGRPGTFPLSYQCTRASTAVLSSSCTYSGLTSGSCLQHYAADPASELCRWDGDRTNGIDCPFGEFFDPVGHCCRVATGDPAGFPICPPGTVFTKTSPGIYTCFPDGSVSHVATQSEKVAPPVCPNICSLTEDICSARNLVFCSTMCSCLSVGVKCPTH
ncbi:MAG: formylglycine-generating enzyme family protein [Anaerolineales bacterium]